MSSTFTPPGDGWIEGLPDGDVGPIEIVRHAAWKAGKVLAGVEQVWHRPVASWPLPLRPGYYLAEDPTYADGPVVAQLRADGDWADLGGYLTEAQVLDLGRLQPLALVADILDEVAEITVNDLYPRPVWEQFRTGLEAIAARYGVPR